MLPTWSAHGESTSDTLPPPFTKGSPPPLVQAPCSTLQSLRLPPSFPHLLMQASLSPFRSPLPSFVFLPSPSPSPPPACPRPCPCPSNPPLSPPSLRRFLVEQGADVNLDFYHSGTPLHWACERGHVSMVKKLLSTPVRDELCQRLNGDYHTPFQAREPRVLVVGHNFCPASPAQTQGRCAASPNSARRALWQGAKRGCMKHHASSI